MRKTKGDTAERQEEKKAFETRKKDKTNGIMAKTGEIQPSGMSDGFRSRWNNSVDND